MQTLSKITIIVLIVSFLASGCSSKKAVVLESEKPAAKPKVVNQLKLQRLWSVDLGSSYSRDSEGFQIQQEGGIIYAASQSGQVKAIEQRLQDTR